jgi:hypothetical protein
MAKDDIIPDQTQTKLVTTSNFQSFAGAFDKLRKESIFMMFAELTLCTFTLKK